MTAQFKSRDLVGVSIEGDAELITRFEQFLFSEHIGSEVRFGGSKMDCFLGFFDSEDKYQIETWLREH